MEIATQSWGPVDLAVVLFEGNRFNGDIAPALADLQSAGTVRILDLALVQRDGDAVTVTEIEDSELSDTFTELTGERVDLLNDVDLAAVGAGLEPDSSALVVVWENTWAARLATAVRDSGGYLVAHERIPADTVAVAVEALSGD